jgi:hypothetical protein
MVDGDGGTDEKRGNDGSCYVYHPPIGNDGGIAELAFSVADKKFTGPRTLTASILDPKNSPKP